jgi:hypothetical protein
MQGGLQDGGDLALARVLASGYLNHTQYRELLRMTPVHPHTPHGRRFQSESTLQDIEIGANCPDLDV